MRRIGRRGFLGAGAAGLAVLAAPAVLGQARPRAVVVGGGSGGATAARYLARDGAGAIDVTLIEPARRYDTCYFGNLYIGGFRDLESLGHSYARLATEYGINVVHDWADAIDRDAREVRLASGGSVPYDRLILSPGIAFRQDAIEGWDIAALARMPHAYTGGTQVALLRAQIEAMPPGGLFVMVAPPNPYRCPPGPYERISMIAHLLSGTNPTAKIVLIDPKETFSKQALFEEAWGTLYPGMIDRLPTDLVGPVERVDAGTMEIVTATETFRADAANIIGPQEAGRIAHRAGLVNEAGWVPVSAFDMRSREDEAIFVLGDSAQQGDMPKSAYAANSQAKVAAMVVRSELTGSRAFPARYANTCWSLLGPENGVKIGATYEPTEEKIATVEGSNFVSQTGEDAELRAATYRESLDWYDAIVADMFG
ncbi:NAD(P)/FAD-dependent oxidoreductase [Rubellimicrobium sp. CFH 75288]|uniref:NAD(P)/FAD-dependent oxidoreductase n=1 Tax=Rubellimicrobium sp. CFH 75288 TaxID=2697034 RepID=UPI0014128088|nr:NAD(P)/FAD-dependent oxidoreductase [Rubellimicrobium sp. CFH 75288]NAZ37701.1 FAD-dependent oxidoreductase [Rubellimicrobium sp. CFH 75288]